MRRVKHKKTRQRGAKLAQHKNARRSRAQHKTESRTQPLKTGSAGAAGKNTHAERAAQKSQPAGTSVKDAAPRRPLSSEALAVADQLHSAAIHLLRRLRIRDLASGVGPAQLSALSVLVFGGSRSLGELAEAEQVRAPTMSRIVAGLERSGLVRRHATEDARRVRLEATVKGTKIMLEGRDRRVESLAQALASLPEAEIRQLAGLVHLLQQLLRSL